MSPLIDNAVTAVTKTHWKNYCAHVKIVENDMWVMDSLQDDIEPFIIQLTGSSTDSH